MKTRGLLSILFDYASDKKRYYIVSIIAAIISVASGIIPFYFIADIITKLINHQNVFTDYLVDIIIILFLFLTKGLFHVLYQHLYHILQLSKLLRQLERERLIH